MARTRSKHGITNYIGRPRLSTTRVVASVLVLAVQGLGGFLSWRWCRSGYAGTAPQASTETFAQVDSWPFDSGRAVVILQAAGWDQVAARSVIALNALFLAVVAESSLSECESVFKRLARLSDPRHS
jgi:hypothetical protein